MTAVLLDSDPFTFNDGNAGHVINLGSAPAVGDIDILCVNSNTTVSTPSGFTVGRSDVGGQGAYIFYRFAVGGEAATVTITTSGNHETAVMWSRWDDVIAFDVGAGTQVNGIGGASTPPHSTGVLAETGELVIAFGALHAIAGANQNTPVWSAGFTALGTAGPQGSGGSGVINFTGYDTNAGTAAETPQVSWSGSNADDRYMLTVAFTSEPAVPQLTGQSDVIIGATGDLLPVNQLTGQSDVIIGATGLISGAVPNSYTLVSQLTSALLTCLCDAVAANPNPPDHCCYRVGTEPVHDIDLETGVDLCCEGLAYVLLRDVYPSSQSFPENDIVRQAQARCSPPSWGIGLRVGVVRCAPTTSDCDLNNEAFIQNLYDMQAINSTMCCFRDYINSTEEFMGMSLVIERQVQGSTSGGCTERYVNLVAQIPNLDCDCG